MKALVTGAAGFIGGHVAAALAAEGASVRILDRASPPRIPPGDVDVLVGDVHDPDTVARAVDGCDTVFHLAAVYSYSRTEAEAMERVNVEGTRTLLEAGARSALRPRIVVTSSCATCGPVPGRPADERDRPPSWELDVPYKRTKLLQERLALDAAAQGQDVVVVCPTTPVGPGDDRPTPTGKMVADVASGRIRAFTDTAINVVAVQDVAHGHILAHERGRAGERYLLGGDNLALREVFAILARAAGRPAPRVRVPYRAALGAAWTADRALRLVGREPRLLVLDEVRLARLEMTFSSAKAQRELGYSWRPAEEALTAAVAALDGGPVGPSLMATRTPA